MPACACSLHLSSSVGVAISDTGMPAIAPAKHCSPVVRGDPAEHRCRHRHLTWSRKHSQGDCPSVVAQRVLCSVRQRVLYSACCRDALDKARVGQIYSASRNPQFCETVPQACGTPGPSSPRPLTIRVTQHAFKRAPRAEQHCVEYCNRSYRCTHPLHFQKPSVEVCRHLHGLGAPLQPLTLYSPSGPCACSMARVASSAPMGTGEVCSFTLTVS